MDNKELNIIVDSLTNDIVKNKNIFYTYIANNYDARTNPKYFSLFSLLGCNSDELKIFKAIEALSLLNFNNLSVNIFDKDGDSFIHKLIKNKFDSDYLVKVFNLFINNKKINVNLCDYDGNTYMHLLLNREYGYDFDNIMQIYKAIDRVGFDSTVCNKKGKNISDVFSDNRYDGKSNNEFMEFFVKSYNNQTNKNEKLVLKIDNDTKNNNINENNNELINKLSRFGSILTDKNFNNHPAIGRDKEVEELILSLALDNKNPLLVGESGVGKTAIVEELAYLIKNKKCPKFLNNKIILEVCPSELVSGTKYRGDFESKITELMKACDNENVILFVDEIHTMYGTGSNLSDPTDMASMIKYHCDRKNIKIIGTTTDIEYDKYFSGDALKRRFEKIEINEPDDNMLYTIVDTVIKNKLDKNNMELDSCIDISKIINILIDLTNKRCRKYNDVINNPDLVLSIIDKVFAYAKVNDLDIINKDCFVKAINSCSRLYDSVKEDAIEELNCTLENKILKLV